MNPLVIITSVIHIKPKINIKSHYSDDIRLEQTINTIKTVKTHLPNAYILLSEGSILTGEEYDKLSSHVNHLLLINNDDITKSKSIGELRIMIESINYIKNSNIVYNKIYKLSGRYWLNDNFNDNNYSTSQYTFKIRQSQNSFIKHMLNGKELTTFLFCVPYKKVNDFYQLIQNIHYKLTNNYVFRIMNIETSLYLSIDDKDINYITILGCSGNSGVNGLLISS